MTISIRPYPISERITDRIFKIIVNGEAINTLMDRLKPAFIKYKEISKKRGKVYGFFIDLKAAFGQEDSMERNEGEDIRRGLTEQKKYTNRLKMQ